MRNPKATKISTPLLILGATLTGFSAQATAQERAVEEVVVTALKGATGTALSDTAMGITAIDGAYLEELAATNINSVIERTAGASLFQLNPVSTTIQIRGISANRGDALVGYYIDDFSYVSLLGVSTPDIIPFDLARVEVLKGPQGTLYGAGSTGGTVRILSNKPDAANGFSGKIELGVHTISGGSDGNHVAGMLNIPIVADTLALRLSGYVQDHGGWLDYNNGPDDFNEIDNELYKVQLGFTPGDRLRVDVGYHKKDIETAPPYSDSNLVFALPEGIDHPATEIITSIAAPIGVGISAGALGPLFAPNAQSVQQQVTDIYAQNIGAVMPPTPFSVADSEVAPKGTLPFDNSDYELLTAALTYDFDSVQLYITANTIEESSLGLAQISLARDGYQGTDLETSNVELRLASKNEGPLNWTAGLFYLDHEESLFLGAAIFPVFDFAQVAGVVSVPGAAGVPLPAITSLTSLTLANNAVESQQQAIFGEVHYEFTDNVELTVGLRYFEDEREARELGAVAAIMEGQGLANPWKEKFDGVDGRINLKVNLSEDLMTYFSVATAHRAGLANLGVTQAAEFVNRPDDFVVEPYTDEEKLIAYEIGAKWFASDSFYVDGAIYYNDWQDIILEVTEMYIDPQIGALTAGLVRENAGDARSYGLEASINWVPTETITVTAGVNLMEAEYLDPPDNSGVNDGDQIQSVPDWTGFAGLDYEQPVSMFSDVSLFSGSKVVAGLFASYTGERFSYGSGGETAKTDSFERVDARAGLAADTWSLTLHVKNVLDSDDRTFNTTGSLAIEPYDAYMQPRTTELVFKYAF